MKYLLALILLISGYAHAQLSDPQMIPQPAEVTDGPYQPQALLPGGIVIPIYPPESPYLNKDRLHEAEVYNMHPEIPGRVQTMVNVHNPSIEVHLANKGSNTGAAVILLAGGGHKRLWVGIESADLVPHFYKYGVNTFILRYRLRSDGYNAEVDPVNDTLQAVRLVRSLAKDLNLDPNKIGLMGFSAGGEPSANAVLRYKEFDAANNSPNDPLSGISSRPDFVSLIYTGPSLITKAPDSVTIPADAPPAFICTASYGGARHTTWSFDYYMALLKNEVPNIEIHAFGNGGHGGGISDRGGIPFGAWPDRFTDWFRDLGFLSKQGIPTKAAQDIEKRLESIQ